MAALRVLEDDVWARCTEPPEFGAFPPPLAPQLLVAEPEAGRNWVRIGDRLYGALDMVLGPRQERPFRELLAGIADAGLPFRFSMRIEGGGLQGFRPVLAETAASVFAVTSEDSRHVRDALAGLRKIRGDEQAVVRLSVGLLTWVAADGGEVELGRRVSRLRQIAEGWGQAEFSPLVGDVLEALAGSVPGFAFGTTAQAAIAPLSAALGLLPVFRPASSARPERADYLFRSEDGKPLAYSLEESGDFGCDLVHGIPGRGKSVLLGSLSLAFCLQGGQRRLPLLAVVDIGPSSSGLISLVREALPEDRRYEAGWFKLQMTREQAVNPCDTALGCRYPLPPEREFLFNFLALLLTPVGEQAVPDGVAETISPMIDSIYAMRDDARAGADPHRYTRGRDGNVDAALERRDVHLPEDPLWWDAVDRLFEAGEMDAAGRAQRFAAPTLVDCLQAVREPAVQDLVAETRYRTGGESVTSAVVRILRSLAGEWPNVFSPTAFDTGHVRVAGIDLSSVAPQGSPEADRQTAAMYMLARHALTRHWWIGEEVLDRVPAGYRDWHARRFREIRETPKRLVFDEYHRTASAPGVRAQVDRDVREARKQRVRLMLASQREADFGPLKELATGFWVLGAGGTSEEQSREVAEMFGLGAAAVEAVRYRLTGPSRTGAPALHIAVDAGGRLERVMVNSARSGGALGAQHGAEGRGAENAGDRAPGRGRGPGRPGAPVPGGLGARASRGGDEGRRRRRGRGAGAGRARGGNGAHGLCGRVTGAPVFGDGKAGRERDHGNRMRSTNCAGPWRKRSSRSRLRRRRRESPICRECGCWDWNACVDARDGPCRWVEEDLCSVSAARQQGDADPSLLDGNEKREAGP